MLKPNYKLPNDNLSRKNVFLHTHHYYDFLFGYAVLPGGKGGHKKREGSQKGELPF
jgi:hypothetical protein